MEALHISGFTILYSHLDNIFQEFYFTGQKTFSQSSCGFFGGRVWGGKNATIESCSKTNIVFFNNLQQSSHDFLLSTNRNFTSLTTGIFYDMCIPKNAAIKNTINLTHISISIDRPSSSSSLPFSKWHYTLWEAWGDEKISRAKIANQIDTLGFFYAY